MTRTFEEEGLSANGREARPELHQIPDALKTLAKSAYTLFTAPETLAHHRTVELNNSHIPQPVQPAVTIVCEKVHKLLQDVQPKKPVGTTFADKIIKTAYMIQFADHISTDQRLGLLFRYEDMLAIKAALQNKVDLQDRPLDFAEQLEIVLTQNNGDLYASLLNLCFVSRHFARWHDKSIIQGMPNIDPQAAIQLMEQWRTTLLACKLHSEDEPQDPAGDTYYAWTHTLAQTIFGPNSRIFDQLAKRIFLRGTDIMHTAVHTFNKQEVPSDHRIAASYGNAIGHTIVAHLTR